MTMNEFKRAMFKAHRAGLVHSARSSYVKVSWYSPKRYYYHMRTSTIQHICSTVKARAIRKQDRENKCEEAKAAKAAAITEALSVLSDHI